MVLTSSICRRPRRRDLAVFSDIASLQSDPLRGREQQSLVEGVTTGAPEIKAHFVRTGCKHNCARGAAVGGFKTMLKQKMYESALIPLSRFYRPSDSRNVSSKISCLKTYKMITGGSTRNCKVRFPSASIICTSNAIHCCRRLESNVTVK